MYKICFYVPASHLERVKNALFEQGAGRYRHYDRCCWQVLGEGQFRPLDGSQPFIGHPGAEENLPEYKVEMICAEPYLKSALKAFFEAHPYQEPAYAIQKIIMAEDLD